MFDFVPRREVRKVLLVFISTKGSAAKFIMDQIPNLLRNKLEVNAFFEATTNDEVRTVTFVLNADIFAEFFEEFVVCNRSRVLGVQMIYCKLCQVRHSVKCID